MSTVGEHDAGERLDRFVARRAGLSRAEAKRLVEAGGVAVDGVAVDRASARVDVGAVVEVDTPAAPPPAVEADDSVTFDVVHEDDTVIVIDKPAGLVVHPGAGRTGGTLVDGLLARFPELAGVGPEHRPGIVHRLDRGTSGLLVVARTNGAHESLGAAMAGHEVERDYDTVVWGRVGSARGIIDAPLGRSRRDPTKRAVVADGRPARTHYRVTARFDRPDRATRLDVRLETGRTHQIRAHLSAIEHPVVGDVAYGGGRVDVGLDRPFLHARRLTFVHPVSGESVSFEAPLPADLERALGRFREHEEGDAPEP